jgi:hypothetical protein
MRRLLVLIAAFLVPMALAACGGGTSAADEEAKITEAVAFLSTTEGSPGVFVTGRNVVVNYGEVPLNFAETVRKAALDATKAINGRQVQLYVVNSAEVATAVPATGAYRCTITANDGRMAGNNC